MSKRICWLLSAALVTSSMHNANAQFRGGSRTPAQSGNGQGSAPVLPSAKGGPDFSRANPEDITDENFPNLIESFDYPNADISEIVKAISKLTGKNFILDSNIKGGTKISIIAPSRITVAEAYKAFLTALAMNGLTVVPSGNFLKIRRIQDATQENIDTYAGSYFPNGDQLITRIVRLKYISAVEIEKALRGLVNKNGDLKVYEPTNSLIITDLGSNVERINSILSQLDVPGFEEKLVVIPIRYARAKDISDLIDQIINKGDRNRGGSQFNPGIPRFRTGNQPSTGGSGAANYSLVLPDNRTNAIIVVGNDAGIERIRDLVRKLDFKLNPEDAGGVYVYYVRHGEAEKIANVLNGIATESAKKTQQAASSAPAPVPTAAGSVAPSQAVFGGDVKVAFDKENNSLIITASKPDYEVVRAILAKIDIPRDQVFVKAIIMEMQASDNVSWGIDYYKFDTKSNGLGRAGFRGSSSLQNLVNPENDAGMVLGFGGGGTTTVTVGQTKFENVPSLLGLIKFLKQNANANILSTPQITALDNEESEIVVGENVPISQSTTTTTTGTTAGIERKQLDLKLTLTPFISPDTDSVRLKIDQKIEALSNTTIRASEIANKALTYSTRAIKTNVIVNSNDTAVLGGLMQDEEGESITKVPVLGDIPIIGWLFKSKSTNKSKKNLLVFITPKIIRNAQDSADLLNHKLNERIDFLQQNMKGRDPHGYEVDRLPRKQLSESETEEYLDDGKAAPVTDPINLEDDNADDEPDLPPQQG